MGEPVGVLYEDKFALIDSALRLNLEQISTLQMISENDLDRFEPHGKAALIFVQESGTASALALIATLKKRTPSLRILVAFQALNAADLRLLIEAGADAFVAQNTSPDELSAALMALWRGKSSFGEAPASALAAPMEVGGNLTRRETDILRLISSGFSNKEVARQLDLSVRTVETHRLNLRRKTQTGRLSDLVSLARTLRLTPVLDVEPSKDRSFAR